MTEKTPALECPWCDATVSTWWPDIRWIHPLVTFKMTWHLGSLHPGQLDALRFGYPGPVIEFHEEQTEANYLLSRRFLKWTTGGSDAV